MRRIAKFVAKALAEPENGAPRPAIDAITQTSKGRSLLLMTRSVPGAHTALNPEYRPRPRLRPERADWAVSDITTKIRRIPFMFTDVTFFPDLDGEVTSVTDANGFETTFAYDNLGLLVGESEETEVTMGSMTYNTMEPVATYAYNPDSDLLAVTDGDNHTVTSTYNDLNELTAVEKRRRRHDGLQLRRRWQRLDRHRRPRARHDLRLQRHGSGAHRDRSLGRRDDDLHLRRGRTARQPGEIPMQTPPRTPITRPTRWSPRKARPAD